MPCPLHLPQAVCFLPKDLCDVRQVNVSSFLPLPPLRLSPPPPQLMTAMISKMGDQDDDPLPQEKMDGCDSDEWSD